MITPGRIAYLAYYQPMATLARCRREGGPWQQWLDARGRRAMIAAARTLPAPPRLPSGAPVVHFLTGRRFWYQTAFCIYSLRRQGAEVSPVFLDDGTFDAALFAESQRLFPGSRVVSAPESETHLDRVLPATRFPTLRTQRRTYLHLRKLTDVHAGRSGWQLVLDSDLLCFRRPDALLAWLANPNRPVHMLDVHDAYGYPAATLADLAGGPVPSCVNVGVCGFRSESLDWDLLERWATQLLTRHGTNYYLEQALVALLAARTNPLRLPRTDYLLLPDLAECQRPTAALHHYVDLSKRGYFRHAWRLVAPS